MSLTSYRAAPPRAIKSVQIYYENSRQLVAGRHLKQYTRLASLVCDMKAGSEDQAATYSPVP